MSRTESQLFEAASNAASLPESDWATFETIAFRIAETAPAHRGHWREKLAEALLTPATECREALAEVANEVQAFLVATP